MVTIRFVSRNHYRSYHIQFVSQPMNMFRFGSQPLQQSQMIAPTRINTGPLSGGAAANDASIGKMSTSYISITFRV